MVPYWFIPTHVAKDHNKIGAIVATCHREVCLYSHWAAALLRNEPVSLCEIFHGCGWKTLALLQLVIGLAILWMNITAAPIQVLIVIARVCDVVKNDTMSQIHSMCHCCWVIWASTEQELWNQPKCLGLCQGLICKTSIGLGEMCLPYTWLLWSNNHTCTDLHRPWLEKLSRKTPKSLRRRLARRAAKSKTPLVKKTVNKQTGKVQVSMS